MDTHLGGFLFLAVVNSVVINRARPCVLSKSAGYIYIYIHSSGIAGLYHSYFFFRNLHTISYFPWLLTVSKGFPSPQSCQYLLPLSCLWWPVVPCEVTVVLTGVFQMRRDSEHCVHLADGHHVLMSHWRMSAYLYSPSAISHFAFKLSSSYTYFPA